MCCVCIVFESVVSALYYALLFDDVLRCRLCCTVLYCSLLCCAVMCCVCIVFESVLSALYYALLFDDVLRCRLCCTLLYCTLLYYAVLY